MTSSGDETKPSWLHRAELVLLFAMAGGALFLAGAWVGSARGGSPDEQALRTSPMPDWFLPIADAYDRNPRITPSFDFAALHDARPQSYVNDVEQRRGAMPTPFRLVFHGRDEPAPANPGGWMHVGPFTATQPFCTSGSTTTLEAQQSSQTDAIVTRLHTCDDESGSATALIDSGVREHGGTGSWKLVEGTGQYENLRGQGTFTSVRTSASTEPPLTFVSTWSGVVAFDAAPPVVTISQASAVRSGRPRGTYRVRIVFGAVDAPGQAVRYLIEVRSGARTLGSKGGTTGSGRAAVVLDVRPQGRTRALRLEITASDPVGNEASFARILRLPR
jgi:hypothetical protein